MVETEIIQTRSNEVSTHVTDPQTPKSDPKHQWMEEDICQDDLPQHLSTINARSNLAITYKHLGKYEDAERLQIEVLRLRSSLLGAEHPDTIFAMGNLANTQHSLEKYADAEKLQIEVLDLGNRIFGEEHPKTITAAHNPAITYKTLGKYPDAKRLLLQYGL